MADPLLSIVLPVHNQADHVRPLIEELEQALARLPSPHECILVENGSRDATLDVCRELAKQYPGVRVVSSEQGGWGRAVRLGLREARGDVLCYTNSARTGPEDLVILLRYALAYPDGVVKANRKIREGLFRRLGSLLYNLQCRALFDLSYWDINGTPKVFPRRFGRLLALTRDDDLLDAEFLVLCRREGYRVLEVPIFSTRRRGGRSTTTLRTAFRLYAGAFRLWWAMRK